MTTPAPYPPVDGTQPCASEDPERFFMTSSREVQYGLARVLEVCARCPFRRPCLAYALTHDVDGVWGGTTRTGRVALRAEHGITAVPIVVSDTDAAHDLIELLDRGGRPGSDVARRAGVTTRTIQRRRAARRRKENPDE